MATRSPRHRQERLRSPEREAEISAAAAALPAVPPIVQEAVKELLMEQKNDVYRPPEKTAALLALIAELDRLGQPFPEREVIARALDCSVYTVDAALSTRMAEGYITMGVKVVQGDVQQRAGVRKFRTFTPSPELKDVADRARRRAARVARMGEAQHRGAAAD